MFVEATAGRRQRSLAQHLMALEGSGRSAVLTARWPVVAQVVVRDGRITQASSLLAPTTAGPVQPLREAEGPGTAGSGVADPGPSLLREELAIDALRELLAAQTDVAWRRRRPGTGHGLAAMDLSIEAVMREAARRMRVLDTLRAFLSPDSLVRRRSRLTARRVRIREEQWAVLAAARDPVSPRTLAIGLGDSAFRMTCRVAELLQTGLLEVEGAAEPRILPAGWLVGSAEDAR